MSTEARTRAWSHREGESGDAGLPASGLLLQEPAELLVGKDSEGAVHMLHDCRPGFHPIAAVQVVDTLQGLVCREVDMALWQMDKETEREEGSTWCAGTPVES